MNNEHLGAATGGTPERPHAVILAWAIVTCRGPDGEETRHLVGRIASHARLSVDGEHDGEPYISSPLASMDFDARRAVNGRGKVIALQGDPLRPGCGWAMPPVRHPSAMRCWRRCREP